MTSVHSGHAMFQLTIRRIRHNFLFRKGQIAAQRLKTATQELVDSILRISECAVRSTPVRAFQEKYSGKRFGSAAQGENKMTRHVRNSFDKCACFERRRRRTPLIGFEANTAVPAKGMSMHRVVPWPLKS